MSSSHSSDDYPPGDPHAHTIHVWWHKGVLPRYTYTNPDGTEGITMVQIGIINKSSVKSDSKTGDWLILGENAKPTIWVDVVILPGYRHVYTYNWVSGPPPNPADVPGGERPKPPGLAPNIPSGSGAKLPITLQPGAPKTACCGHLCDLKDVLETLPMAVCKLPPEVCLDLDKNWQIDSNDAWLIYKAY